jgi:galactonate dehydratase
VKIDQIAAVSLRVTEKTTWTFVRAKTRDGLTGHGEATLQGAAAAVEAGVLRQAAALQGLVPDTALARIHDTALPQQIAEAAAISGIEQALADLLAQHAGMPLFKTSGAARRAEIPLYANINRGTTDRRPSGFAARAADAVARGFRAIKIAPFDVVTPSTAETTQGRSLITAGIERIAAVRDAIGAADLMVDCHWRFTEAAALDTLKTLAPLNLYWFECPLPEEPDNFTALRRLRSQANRQGTRLAGCEMMIGVAGFRPFLEAEIYDAVMPDVKYAGGVRETMRIAELAAKHGAACSPHNPTGPVAHAHSVHLSAHIEHFPFLEYQDGETPLFFDIVTDGLPDPTHGVSALPASPGLGIALSDAAVQRYRPQERAESGVGRNGS